MTLFNPKVENIMANIGTFTTEKVGFSGQLCTLILNVKVRLVPYDDQKGDRFIYWSTVRYWPRVAGRKRLDPVKSGHYWLAATGCFIHKKIIQV